MLYIRLDARLLRVDSYFHRIVDRPVRPVNTRPEQAFAKVDTSLLVREYSIGVLEKVASESVGGGQEQDRILNYG